MSDEVGARRRRALVLIGARVACLYIYWQYRDLAVEQNCAAGAAHGPSVTRLSPWTNQPSGTCPTPCQRAKASLLTRIKRERGRWWLELCRTGDVLEAMVRMNTSSRTAAATTKKVETEAKEAGLQNPARSLKTVAPVDLDMRCCPCTLFLPWKFAWDGVREANVFKMHCLPLFPKSCQYGRAAARNFRSNAAAYQWRSHPWSTRMYLRYPFVMSPLKKKNGTGRQSTECLHASFLPSQK